MSPLIQFAKYVRDLLAQPEGEVVILGRENMRRDDMTGLQIVVDELEPTRRLTTAQKYDGDSEVMTHSQQHRGIFSVNFYGDGAFEQTQKFILIKNSQKGYELSRDLGIDVYTPTGYQNLKLLTGEQYSERYQIECNVIFTVSAAVDTLRIETAQIEEPKEG